MCDVALFDSLATVLLLEHVRRARSRLRASPHSLAATFFSVCEDSQEPLFWGRGKVRGCESEAT